MYLFLFLIFYEFLWLYIFLNYTNINNKKITIFIIRDSNECLFGRINKNVVKY